VNGGLDPHSGAAIPVAELFHENSKLPPRVSGPDGGRFAQSVAAGTLDGTQGRVYRTGARVALPPVAHLAMDISAVLRRRRSVRSYGQGDVTLWHLRVCRKITLLFTEISLGSIPGLSASKTANLFFYEL
jgi:hypothetical protein